MYKGSNKKEDTSFDDSFVKISSTEYKTLESRRVKAM